MRPARLPDGERLRKRPSRQSGRSVVPAVHDPLELKEFLRRSEFGRHGNPETRRHGEQGCIFWEDGGASFNEAVKKIPFRRVTPFTGSLFIS